MKQQGGRDCSFAAPAGARRLFKKAACYRACLGDRGEKIGMRGFDYAYRTHYKKYRAEP